MKEDKLVLVLTFVTCVAFLEQGIFVQFDKLRALLEELPVSQQQLRSLEIQGQFLVNNMNVFKVWRLHSSIPRTAPKSINTSESQETDTGNKLRQVHEEQSMDVDATDTIDENAFENEIRNSKLVTRVSVSHLPSNKDSRWSPHELSVLHTVRQNAQGNENVFTLYVHYQEECRSQSVPDRSFAAFRAKYRRLCNADSG